MHQPQSLFDKIWAAHEVLPETHQNPAIVYIDLHLIHEVTSPQGFDMLRSRGIKLRRPGRTVATIDHSTPTLPARNGIRPYVTEQARTQVETLRQNCAEFGVELHDWDSEYRGIVHVIGPELGLSQPGRTIVCGDSHTSTHGAFGALAFGIGTTQVGHVMATQCMLMGRPKSMIVSVDGIIGTGVTAKDIVLHIINEIGVDGGTGHVIEYAGSAIHDLSMEGRMTVCNMSIEAGARAGMVGPDECTVEYLRGRPKLMSELDFDGLARRWLALNSDSGAAYDKEAHINALHIAPRITYGTHPGMSIPVDGIIPDPQNDSDRKALDYMGLEPRHPLMGQEVDVVFVGSCTNSRIEDLREAAKVVAGKTVADGVDMLVVPGSEQVRRQAEAEGLHEIFTDAGAQWRIPGCSMCLGMNGDIVASGATAISTSNRNFEGRQGPGARTLLASPATAAASAVAGCVADPRRMVIADLEMA